MQANKFLVGLGMTFTIVFISALLISSNSVFVTPEISTRSWKQVDLWFTGDADPGVGNSGVIEFFVVNHSATPTTDFAINVTATIYANSTVNNTHAGSDVPYSTTFDIVIKVRWNQTHAWNGTAFDPTYTRAYVNCSALSLSALAMTQTQIAIEGTTYVWYNYWVNGTTGYTISKGQNVTSISFNFEAYY